MSQQQPTPAAFKPSAQLIEERARAQSVRDTDTALEVLKLAAGLLTPRGEQPTPSAAQVANYAETLWQWVTTDTWVAPPGQ